MTIIMDKRTGRFWNGTEVSDKCPSYPSNESNEGLASNINWTSEKTLNEGSKTIEAPITSLRELTLNNGQLPQKCVVWGVQWQQQPAFIALCANFGLLLAIGHHMFYLRLNNTLTGTQGRQQFAHAFGNVLAISVATLFAFTCRAAYKQYFWTVVRRKSFTVGGLDSLYSLTSDVLGLLDLEVWGQAPLAALLALACW